MRGEACISVRGAPISFVMSASNHAPTATITAIEGWGKSPDMRELCGTRARKAGAIGLGPPVDRPVCLTLALHAQLPQKLPRRRIKQRCRLLVIQPGAQRDLHREIPCEQVAGSVSIRIEDC